MAGMAESISFCLRGSSVEGGAPRATDHCSLLGLLCWERRVEAVEEAHCNHSKVPWRFRLTDMAMSWGGSTALAGKYISTGVVVGA